MDDAAWSDAILALVSLGLGARLWRGHTSPGGVGLLSVGVAAALGTLRFSGLSSLITAHDRATWVAALVGVPMIGLGYALAWLAPHRADRTSPVAFVALLGLAWLLDGTPAYRTAAGGAGMVLAAAFALATARRDAIAASLGLAGALGVVIAGLAIAGDGAIGPLSRTAWFHLAFAASCGALGAGLRRFVRPPDPLWDQSSSST